MPKLNRFELLRWLGLLPAAVVGGIATRFLGAILWRAVFAGGGAGSETSLAFAAQLFVYAMIAAVFVIFGALMAPRKRTLVALVLASMFGLSSLFTHLIGPDRVGRVNYLHFAAETTGAISSLVYVLFKDREPSLERA